MEARYSKTGESSIQNETFCPQEKDFPSQQKAPITTVITVHPKLHPKVNPSSCNHKQVKSFSNTQTLLLPQIKLGSNPSNIKKEKKPVALHKTKSLTSIEQMQRSHTSSFNATGGFKQFRVAMPVPLDQEKTHQNWNKSQMGLTKAQAFSKTTNRLFPFQDSNTPQNNKKFLSSIGGRETKYEKFSIDANKLLLNEQKKEEKKQELAIFTSVPLEILSIDKPKPRLTKQVQNKKPPLVNNKEKKLSVKNLHYQIQKQLPMPPKGLMKFKQEPETDSQDTGELKKPDWKTICLQTKLTQKPPSFPELFDRSERTIAITFCKSGDLSYFTPIQRIGSFIDFRQRLKRKHLLDLIQYIQSVQKPSNLKQDEDQDQKTLNEYLEQSLFHGYMKNQMAQAIPNEFKKVELPQICSAYDRLQNVKGYDPTSSQALLRLTEDKVWPSLLVQQLQQSMRRFLHYCQQPELIKTTEIAKFQKSWMIRAMNLIPDNYVQQNPDLIKLLFQEVYMQYLDASKEAILDYILRSPDERKRLQILVLPAKVQASADLQVQEGGYSTTQFKGTHQRKQNAEFQLKLHLLTNNIVQSQLKSWFYEFRNFNLIDFTCLEQVINVRNQQCSLAQESDSIDIDNFFQYLDQHMEKTCQLLKNIWFRGAILIIKKFKYFQRKKEGYQNKRWSFQGCENDTGVDSTLVNKRSKKQDEQATPLQQYYFRTNVSDQQVAGFELDSVCSNLFESETLDDLIDIRESVAYQNFVKKQHRELNLKENGYEPLNKDYKRELKYAAGNLMHLQLREIVDRSVENLVAFFEGFYSFKQLLERKQIEPQKVNNIVVTEIKPYHPVSQQTTSPAEPISKVKQNENQGYYQTKSHEISSVPGGIVQNPDPEKYQLKLPDWVPLCNYAKPILKIELLLGQANPPDSQEKDDEPWERQDRKQPLEDQLVFNKTDRDILEQFNTLFNTMLTSLNSFTRPEFCKIKQLSSKKYEQQKQQIEQDPPRIINKQSQLVRRTTVGRRTVVKGLNKGAHLEKANFQEALQKQIFPISIEFDKVMYNQDFKDSYYYQRFMGRINLITAPEEIEVKSLDKSNFLRKEVNRKQNPCKTNEEGYNKQRLKLKIIFEENLDEIKQVKQIYNQFGDLIDGTLKEKIKALLRSIPPRIENQYDLHISNSEIIQLDTENQRTIFTELDSFRVLIEELKMYRCLVSQLPEKMSFPLFEVGLLQPKNELRDRVEFLLIQLLKRIEEDLTQQSMKIEEIVKEIIRKLDTSLERAEDYVEMENFKNSLPAKIENLQQRSEQQNKCAFFLIKHADQQNIFQQTKKEGMNVTEGFCWYYLTGTLSWPQKLQKAREVADELHSDQFKKIDQTLTETKMKVDKQTEEIKKMVIEKFFNKGFKSLVNFEDDLRKAEQTISSIKEDVDFIKDSEMQLYQSTYKNASFDELVGNWDAYFMLFETYSQFSKQDEWRNQTLEQFNADEFKQLIETTEEAHLIIKETLKPIAEKDKQEKLVEELGNLIKKANENMQVLEILAAKELTQEHYDRIQIMIELPDIKIKSIQLSGIVDFIIDPNSDRDYKKELEQIYTEAKGQYNLQQQINEIIDFWATAEFVLTVTEEATSNVFELESFDEFALIVHTHLQRILVINADPDIKPIRKLGEEWQANLQLMNEFLAVIQQIQNAYIVMTAKYHTMINQNSIDSKAEVDESISGQELDLEAFHTFEQVWHSLINKVEHNKKVIALVDIPEVLDKLSAFKDNELKKLKESVMKTSLDLVKQETSESFIYDDFD